MTNLGKFNPPFTYPSFGSSSQTWNNSCVYSHLSNRYARLYEFELEEDMHGFTSIPTSDKNYIKQVYRNEHGSEPHDK